MSQSNSYSDLIRNTARHVGQLRQQLPDVMQGFNQMAKAACASNVLDEKSKEFIALGIAVASRCDDCIGFHTQTLAKLGATTEEVAEALGIAVYMGGGPSLMYAAHALEAFNEFKQALAAK